MQCHHGQFLVGRHWGHRPKEAKVDQVYAVLKHIRSGPAGYIGGTKAAQADGGSNITLAVPVVGRLSRQHTRRRGLGRKGCCGLLCDILHPEVEYICGVQ